MKCYFSIFLFILLTFQLKATSVGLKEGVRIDTVYVSGSALQVEYEVLVPMEQLDMFIINNLVFDNKKKIDPVSLSCNSGAYKKSVSIQFTSETIQCFSVLIKGKLYNKADSLNYTPITTKEIHLKKERNGIVNIRSTYTNEEKLIKFSQKSDMKLVNQEGKLVDGNGLIIEVDELGKIKKSKAESQKVNFIDPMELNICHINFSESPELSVQTVSSKAAINYNISISGYVEARRSSLEAERLYGPMVFLYFVNSNNQNQLYHPCPHNNQLIAGTHFAIPDYQGNYSFNFSTTADLSSYNQIVLCVTRYSDYTMLNIPGETLYYSGNTGYQYQLPVFTRNSTNYISFNPNLTSVSIQNKILNASSNLIMPTCLKWFKLAAKLSNQFGYNPPMIDVYQRDCGTGVSGQFVCKREKDGWLFPTYTEVRWIDMDDGISYSILGGSPMITAAHEYGHYVNYTMWGSTAGGMNVNVDYKETWAIFYSYATRHYAYKNGIGELIDTQTDNLDIGSFLTPRFSNITYPEYSRWASFFWNLYDGNPTYTYDATDNDDIAFPARVVSTFKNVRTLNDFRTSFKNGLTDAEKSSVDAMYSYMMSDYTKMRSQNFATASLGATSSALNVSFTYNSFGFPSGWGLDIRNSPTFFQVFKQRFKDSPWISVGYIPYNTNQTSYSQSFNIPNLSSHNIKLTVSNGFGESCYPRILTNNNNNTPNLSFFASTPPSSLFGISPNTSYQFSVTSMGGLVQDYLNDYRWNWYVHETGGWVLYAYSSGNNYNVSMTFPGNTVYYSDRYIELKCEGSNSYTGQKYTAYASVRCPDCRFDDYHSVGKSNSLAYPNPVSNILNVDLDRIVNETNTLEPIAGDRQLKQELTYDIRLYDGMGILLRHAKAKGGKVEFNVSNLTSGIYFLHIYDGINEKPEMQQIIVEH